MKSHPPSGPAPGVPVASPRNDSDSALHTCPVCSNVGKSAGGLKRHIKFHVDADPVAVDRKSPLECHVCARLCKSLAGLKSHLRAHGRNVHEDEDEGMALV